MQEPRSHVRPDDYDLWSCPDAEATEDEITDFVAAWVRATKPYQVVEIGTYLGHTAEAIGRALKDNGRGWLNTFEIDGLRATEARNRCAGLPVNVVHGDGNQSSAAPHGRCDLVFIDGFLGNRQESWFHWRPRIVPTGVAMFHDSAKYKEVGAFIEQIPEPKIHLLSPRGLTIVQIP